MEPSLIKPFINKIFLSANHLLGSQLILNLIVYYIYKVLLPLHIHS
jgi:hypothetical protein